MSIFDVLKLLGGLCLFLFGMSVMGTGLERRAGSSLKTVFEKLTNNKWRGMLLGLGVTAIIQSSSATTVMVVGFVNSGVMQLSQSTGIIMGANIGTTVTAWLLSLSGIDGEALWIQMLKPSSFTPILAALGVYFYVFQKNMQKKDIGLILLGFATLIFGMDTMSSSVNTLSGSEAFAKILLFFSNPLMGLVTGALLTAIIQSSSASVGVLQALSVTGSVTWGVAIPIILGQNIGTCITALLAAVGANRNAKRAAFIHLYFNMIGAAIFLIGFYIVRWTNVLPLYTTPINTVQIALFHTSFKVLSTAILMPFSKGLEKLARLTIRGSDEEKDFELLDERLMMTPSFAVEQCTLVTNKMAEIVRETIFQSLAQLDAFDSVRSQKIIDAENKVDLYEDKLGTYLAKLSTHHMSPANTQEVARLLHCIGDLERISDHAVNLMEVAEEIHEKKVSFSPEAQAELRIMHNAVYEIVEIAIDAFLQNDPEAASRVEPLEQVVDSLKTQLKSRHINRLQRGDCTTELGFIFNDLISNYERVADHCSNIAVCVIQVARDSFDIHEYLDTLRKSNDENYVSLYNHYQKQYALPALDIREKAPVTE